MYCRYHTIDIFLERILLINLVGIDIGKNSYFVSIRDKLSGEIILNPISLKNNIERFNSLIKHLNAFSKDDILICMKDNGHYLFASFFHIV